MKGKTAAKRRELPAADDPRARLTGIALMCFALVCFCMLDTTAKWLNGHIPTLEVLWARYAGHFALSLVFVNPWTTPGLLSTQRPWLQIFRSVVLVGSSIFNFTALRYLQLDQTSAIMFTTPLFVALCAGPLLGEWIGPRRWGAVLFGFAGVLLVTRPGAGGIHPAAILSLLGAICYALYNIMTRILASYDSTSTTLFYSALVGLIVSTIPTPWIWQTPSNPLVIAAMVWMGALGWIGHLFLIMAHRRAPAPILAPFIYTQIIWMIAAGFIVFGDMPNRWTLSGVAVVIGAGLYLLYRERRMKAEDSLKAQTGE
jgi:drug/metabolite transporter (DMT)-like permease